MSDKITMYSRLASHRLHPQKPFAVCTIMCYSESGICRWVKSWLGLNLMKWNFGPFGMIGLYM